LNGNVMPRRFHGDPRVRSAEPLLYERIPIASPIIEGPTRDEAPPRHLPGVPLEPTQRGQPFDAPTPRTLLLGNGRYSVVVTSAGGGYSRSRDVDVSRWRADTTT